MRFLITLGLIDHIQTFQTASTRSLLSQIHTNKEGSFDMIIVDKHPLPRRIDISSLYLYHDMSDSPLNPISLVGQFVVIYVIQYFSLSLHVPNTIPTYFHPELRSGPQPITLSSLLHTGNSLFNVFVQSFTLNISSCHSQVQSTLTP